MKAAGLGAFVEDSGWPVIPLEVDESMFLTILGLCQERQQPVAGRAACSAAAGAAGALTATHSTVYGYISSLKYAYACERLPCPGQYDTWDRTFLEGAHCLNQRNECMKPIFYARTLLITC